MTDEISDTPTAHLAQGDAFTWDDIPVLQYKEDGTHFRTVTRQVLFDGAPDLPCQLRYFEIAAEGHSTLERHQHRHLVMILLGAGEALVGEQILPLSLHDVVEIPPGAWHQFRATAGAALGFLCLVPVERDRPERPGPAELEELRQTPEIATFIRL